MTTRGLRMADFRSTVARLRADADYPDDAPLAVERLLPRLYAVASVLLPRLSVAALREWLARHNADVPSALSLCRDRRLRGAVVAWRGHGLLCVDEEDGEQEQRFTFAHEGAHFLQDHLYPRRDLLDRYGPDILPVLDGLRQPTTEERVAALLGRTSLTLLTHLMERGPELTPCVDAAEAEADCFACEVLAPAAALATRFRGLKTGETAVTQVCSVLRQEFGLPAAPATTWARRFVSRYGEPVTLLHRLGLS